MLLYVAVETVSSNAVWGGVCSDCLVNTSEW